MKRPGGVRVGLRVGLIGVGAVSEAHLIGYRDLKDLAIITAVCDADASRARAVAGEVGAESFGDSDELVRSGLVDAVDIMLPHHLHAEVALKALQTGLHVLLEKPATRTLSEFTSLEQAASSKDLVFAVAENTPYVAAYRVVEDLLTSGVVGDVESVRTLISGGSASYRSAAPSWQNRQDEALGGVLYDCGAHSFYLMEWLFGGVADVLAVAAKRDYSEVEQFGVVTGKLCSGADYLMESIATGVLPWSERLEVYGSNGSLVVDQLVDPVVKVYGDEHDWNGTARPDVPFQPSKWKSKSIADEVVDFVESIMRGGSHRVKLEYVRATTLALAGAYDSLERGSRRVVLDRSAL